MAKIKKQIIKEETLKDANEETLQVMEKAIETLNSTVTVYEVPKYSDNDPTVNIK